MYRLRCAQSGRFLPSASTIKATANYDLPKCFKSLIEDPNIGYKAFGISPTFHEGFRPLKLIQNAGRGSKMNENYCFRVAGLNKTMGAVPAMCRTLNKPMVWNNEVMYKLVIGEKTNQIATEMGLLSHDIDQTKTNVNNAPITLRHSNFDHTFFKEKFYFFEKLFKVSWLMMKKSVWKVTNTEPQKFLKQICSL